MYFYIWIDQTPTGEWRTLPPDFPATGNIDADRSRLLAMTRLAMEDAMGHALGTSGKLPVATSLEALKQNSEFSNGEWLQMHFQRAQLIALAAHQYQPAT